MNKKYEYIKYKGTIQALENARRWLNIILNERLLWDMEDRQVLATSVDRLDFLIKNPHPKRMIARGKGNAYAETKMGESVTPE